MSSPLPPPSDQGWTTIISPHCGWLDWRLKQLWRYRDLISLFVWRDFVSAYKQTILGPLWHIIQPLLTTIVEGGSGWHFSARAAWTRCNSASALASCSSCWPSA